MNLSTILALPVSTNPRLIRADDTGILYEIAAGAAGSSARPVGSERIIDIQLHSEKMVIGTLEPGQIVRTNGCILVSGAGTAEANGIYTERGEYNGKPYYNKLGFTNDPLNSAISFGDGESIWVIYAYSGAAPLYETPYDASGEATPDLVTEWAINLGEAPNPTVTAYQFFERYSAPDETIVAVFVPGYGVYTERGEHNGYPYYNLLGAADDAGINAVNTDALGYWAVIDGAGVELYLSWNNTSLFPWLADWDNQIAPSSITRGELEAGVTVSGADSGNGSFVRTSINNGRCSYYDEKSYGYGRWIFADVNHLLGSSLAAIGVEAFPWQADWSGGVVPAPTVTRNDAANPANWTAINSNVNNAYVGADAPILPVQAYIDAALPFYTIFNEMALDNKGITYIDHNRFYFYGGFISNLRGNHLTIANIENLLDAAVTSGLTSQEADFGGQTPPAPPTRPDSAMIGVDYFENSGTYNAHNLYVGAGIQARLRYNGSEWELWNDGDESQLDAASPGNTTYPWEATGWAGDPVTQALNASVQTLIDSGWTVITD